MFHYEDRVGIDRHTAAQTPAMLSVADLAGRIWRARFWAAGFALAAIVAALLFNAVVTPSYEASAQVYVDPQDLQVLGNDINPNPPAGDSGAVFIESQARIMESAGVLRAVVRKLDLTADPEFGGSRSLLSQLLPFGGSDESSPDKKELAAVATLAKSIHVVRADRTYFIEIYARSEKPEMAAAIANAVVSTYMTLREQQRAAQADQTSASLQLRLDDLRGNVAQAEEAVERFKAANNIVVTNSGSLLEGRLGEANRAASDAQRTMDEAKAQLDQLAQMKGNPDMLLSSPQASRSADMLRLRGDYERAQASLDTLGATKGPNHPAYLEAQSELEAVSRSIDRELQRMQSNARLEYARAEAEHTAALSVLDRLTVDFQRSDDARVQLRELEREAQSTRAVYEQALLRARETSEQGQLSTVNMQVISEATAPLTKRFPPRLSILLPLALILGTGLRRRARYGAGDHAGAGAGRARAIGACTSVAKRPRAGLSNGRRSSRRPLNRLSRVDLPMKMRGEARGEWTRRQLLAGAGGVAAALGLPRLSNAADARIDIDGNRLTWRGAPLRLTGVAVGDPTYIRADRPYTDYQVIANDWRANCVRISVQPGLWRADREGSATALAQEYRGRPLARPVRHCGLAPHRFSRSIRSVGASRMGPAA